MDVNEGAPLWLYGSPQDATDRSSHHLKTLCKMLNIACIPWDKAWGRGICKAWGRGICKAWGRGICKAWGRGICKAWGRGICKAVCKARGRGI